MVDLPRGFATHAGRDAIIYASTPGRASSIVHWPATSQAEEESQMGSIRTRYAWGIAALLAACMWSTGAPAQTACAKRGDLDARYCDEDGDLVADQPKDPKTWQNPAT